MRKNRKINIEEELEGLTRRIDNIATELHTSDSEHALHQIPELKKQLDALTSRLAMFENEFRIFRDAVFALQKTVYPQIDKAELAELKKLLKIIFNRKKRT